LLCCDWVADPTPPPNCTLTPPTLPRGAATEVEAPWLTAAVVAVGTALARIRASTGDGPLLDRITAERNADGTAGPERA
jgi:hypothetical protein